MWPLWCLVLICACATMPARADAVLETAITPAASMTAAHFAPNNKLQRAFEFVTRPALAGYAADMSAFGTATASVFDECSVQLQCFQPYTALFEASFGDGASIGGARIFRQADPKTTAAPSDAMTFLDIALMVAFATALIAFQLDRKTRQLKQATLFGASY
jgi:hypothetical protein